MKKFYSFALILLTLFSSVIFFACGDSYKNLSMEVYGANGEHLSEVCLTIDKDNNMKTRRIGVEVNGIKDNEIGKIVVYSIPNEILLVENYTYEGNMVYVDYVVNMSTGKDAKLIISHLDSGKKKEIPLIVKQKAYDLGVKGLNYVIEIPAEETYKEIDFTKVINLMPANSNDEIYFKIKPGYDIDGVEPVLLEGVEGYKDDVCTGLKVDATVVEGETIQIYPVTRMEGYEREFVGGSDRYKDCVITVCFYKPLKDGEIILKNERYHDLDLSDLKLIANDGNFNSLSFDIYIEKTATSEKLYSSKYSDLYTINPISNNENEVLAFIDGNGKFVVRAENYTYEKVGVRINAVPNGYVGEICSVGLDIAVKGDVKADDIQTFKNGTYIEDLNSITIFDYYEEGNSLGSQFRFRPISYLGEVADGLSEMRIVLDPTVLNADCSSSDSGLNVVYTNDQFNVPSLRNDYETGGTSKTVKNQKYALSIYLNSNPMKFYFDANSGNMISERFSDISQIHIKHVQGNGLTLSNFGISVETINSSSVVNWENISGATISINFNPVKGVKSMLVDAGYRYENGGGTRYASGISLVGSNSFDVYVDRTKGLDDADSYLNFVVAKDVKGEGDSDISETQMEVFVESAQYSSIPLGISKGEAGKDSDNYTIGLSLINYQYLKDSPTPERIGLIFRSNTSLGEYFIVFKQDNIEKARLKVVVYEEFNEFNESMIYLETNEKAFKNDKWADYDSDYIVASGQQLDIEINLPEAVINSQIINGYEFSIIFPGVLDTSYFNYKHNRTTDPYAILDFKKGTNVGGVNECFEFVIKVVRVKFEGNSSIFAPGRYDGEEFQTDEEKDKESKIKFFIYEEISKNSISINQTSMVRYYEEYLGVDYKHQSRATLEILMENEGFWNYVSKQGLKEVVWIQDDSLLPDGDRECLFTFSARSGYNSYISVVKAYVYQFNNFFELQCVFNVKKPILTTSVVIDSELSIQKETKEYYINLKETESYTVKARNISKHGEVTNPGVAIMVADMFGDASNARPYFTIEYSALEVKLIVNDVTTISDNNFKLIVFAKDVLKSSLTYDRNDYLTPSNFIISEDGGEYENAYFIINVILSDGTKENPYLIQTADDFYQIDDNDTLKNSYYQVRNSISLDESKKEEEWKVNGFKGSIKTYNNYIYTFDGISLTKDRKNLFTNFSGIVKNIKFIVDYAYVIDSSFDQHLGVFDKNGGTLTNVSVEISGGAELRGSGTFYFGGLVGENTETGKIQYKKGKETLASGQVVNWEQVIGVYGTFGKDGTFNSDSTTYFGGLVGKNLGSVIGCSSDSGGGADTVVLSGSQGRTDSLSIVEVYATLDSGAIGGAIGLNSGFGKIENAFIGAKIYASESDNVGGVIGKNDQTTKNLTIYSDDTAGISYNYTDVISTHTMKFVKSASKVYGKDNVGGLVGLDIGGLYYDCDFQVLTESEKTKSVEGNSKVGGIAGSSEHGKFIFCSVMSYPWRYDLIGGTPSDDNINAITGVEDIHAKTSYAGGIVGYSVSDAASLDPGANTVIYKVIIISSSVNAFIKTEETGGAIGGILSSNGQKSIVYNSYFIGKLVGNLVYDSTYNLIIDNDKSSIANNVYTINLDGNDAKTGKYVADTGLSFVLDTSIDVDYWWYNANINGGYVFVTKDKDGTTTSMPIFDVAPEQIDITVNGSATDLERVIRLDYYDFSVNSNITEAQMLDLKQEKNVLSANDFIAKFNFDIKPAGLGTVVLNVVSSNSSIVDVTFDGRLIINNIGECWLTFSSALNPNAGDETLRKIKVVVDYPIGDSFNIVANGNRLVSGGTESIAKGSTKQYQPQTTGYIEEPVGATLQRFNYRTKSNLGLYVKIKHSADDTLNLKEYLSVSGKGFDPLYSGGVVEFKLTPNDPFMISIQKYLGSGHFEVFVAPYTLVNNGIRDIESKYYEYSTVPTFKIITSVGVRNAAFSYDDAIIYPNDTVYLNIDITTDSIFSEYHEILKQLEIEVFNGRYTFNLVGENLVSGEISNLTSYLRYEIKQGSNAIGYFNINIDEIVDLSEEQQTIKFILEFTSLVDLGSMELSEEILLGLYWELPNGDNEKCLLTLIPQRINKIEIKNYYKDKSGDKVLKDVLKPNEAGEIIIDIVPNNGYYSYLEIKDVTGNEEIIFIQTFENGKDSNNEPTSDKKGIKLYKDNDASRMNIITQIDKSYSSKIHTIQVAAYSSSGKRISPYFYKYIDVRMLPEITTHYLRPDGSVDKMIKKSEVATGLFLANGVDANFRIETKNANQEVEIQVDAYRWDSASSKYVLDDVLASILEVEMFEGGFATLRFKSCDAYNLNKKVKITFKACSVYENDNEFDEAICSIEFTITNFVIHGVSVNSSINTVDTKEIYGYFGREINLEFYLGKEDISFHNGEGFWNTEYSLESIPGGASGALSQIYDILEELNTNSTTNPYLILNNNQKSTLSGEYQSVTPSPSIELEKNVLKILDSDFEPKYLAVAFKLDYNQLSKEWSIKKYTDASTGDGSYIVDTNYKLNFTLATKWYEPTVINSVSEFKNMQSGGRYILNVDLIGDVNSSGVHALIDYSPLDVNLVEFDGNGHTIEIRSFAKFNETSIMAGLFKQIYENMVVKNVKVKYVSVPDGNGKYTLGSTNGSSIKYADICNNVDVNYTDAKFGGIAAINNGVITNCYVEGEVALNASTLEKYQIESSDKYNINFFIGGMVVENSSTGYITHSTSELIIYSQANIGGFVHTNSGTIASCGVEKDAVINSYNSNTTISVSTEVAGFAVYNKNKISMSYANFVNGTISAVDISAGFVRTNNGSIVDAYVQMENLGKNSNEFAGFVYYNNGAITRAYTIINKGSRGQYGTHMFAPIGTEGIDDCIEFINTETLNSGGYNSGILKGLASLDYNTRKTRSVYEEYDFAFGDNSSAVWKIDVSSPVLVSTKEFEFDNFKRLEIKQIETIVDGVETVTYDYNLMFVNLGLKENPYIIHDLSTWNDYLDPTKNLYMTSYYRIVKDISFASVENPKTSTVTFNGNIQGNNMVLDKIMLYSTEEDSVIGLFKSLTGVKDKSCKNSVRNLTLTARSVIASSAVSVGLLAGIIENFNLYNITIDSENVILTGGNAVGGLAGVIRGTFDIEQIFSNVGASSTTETGFGSYSIYMSKNNKKTVGYNLSSVYYVGSVAGILDGYNETYDYSSERKINSKYSMVKNIKVSGKIVMLGDTVGSAFGFVGEKVYVKKADINVSGSLFGYEYSAGFVGENRGIIEDANINIADGIFDRSVVVSSGAVGFNVGGLIRNVVVTGNIIKEGGMKSRTIVGGIIGRNIYGVVNNVHYSGKISGSVIGGIMGTHYSNVILMNALSGAGTLSGDCRNNTYLIPDSQVVYQETNGTVIENFKNISISRQTFDYIISTIPKFYSFRQPNDPLDFDLNDIIIRGNVFGLVAGLSYDEDLVEKSSDKYFVNISNDKVHFNSDSSSLELSSEWLTFKISSQPSDEVEYQFTNVNYYELNLSEPYIVYLVGAKATSFDSWLVYGNHYFVTAEPKALVTPTP